MYINHIIKSKAPTPENLQDEKYIKFIQDVVDVYGLIHSRYICSPEGKCNLILNLSYLNLTYFRFIENDE